MTFRAVLSVLLGCMFVTGCMGAPEDLGDANLEVLTARTDGAFLVRRDRCDGATCEGYVVSPVNGGASRCADGQTSATCHVDVVDFEGMALSPAQADALLGAVNDSIESPRVILRGRLAVAGTTRSARLVVSEAWRATSDAPVNGAFYHVSLRSPACASGACDELVEQRVNSLARPVIIAGLNLDQASSLDLEMKARALREAATETGLLVTGFQDSAHDATSGAVAQTLRVQQVFVRVTGTDLTATR